MWLCVFRVCFWRLFARGMRVCFGKERLGGGAWESDAIKGGGALRDHSVGLRFAREHGPSFWAKRFQCKILSVLLGVSSFWRIVQILFKVPMIFLYEKIDRQTYQTRNSAKNDERECWSVDIVHVAEVNIGVRDRVVEGYEDSAQSHENSTK